MEHSTGEGKDTIVDGSGRIFEVRVKGLRAIWWTGEERTLNNINTESDRDVPETFLVDSLFDH